MRVRFRPAKVRSRWQIVFYAAQVRRFAEENGRPLRIFGSACSSIAGCHLRAESAYRPYLVYAEGNCVEAPRRRVSTHRRLVLPYKRGVFELVEHRYERKDLKQFSNRWQHRMRSAVAECGQVRLVHPRRTSSRRWTAARSSSASCSASAAAIENVTFPSEPTCKATSIRRPCTTDPRGPDIAPTDISVTGPSFNSPGTATLTEPTGLKCFAISRRIAPHRLWRQIDYASRLLKAW